MLFQLYGSTAMTQLLGWVLVFAGLVILNEIGRRTKIGGIVLFVIIPAAGGAASNVRIREQAKR